MPCYPSASRRRTPLRKIDHFHGAAEIRRRDFSVSVCLRLSPSTSDSADRSRSSREGNSPTLRDSSRAISRDERASEDEHPSRLLERNLENGVTESERSLAIDTAGKPGNRRAIYLARDMFLRAQKLLRDPHRSRYGN